MGHPEEYMTDGHIRLSFPPPALRYSRCRTRNRSLVLCLGALTLLNGPVPVYVVSLTSRPQLALVIACTMPQSIYYNVPVKIHLPIVCSWKKKKDIIFYCILFYSILFYT
jgi:hypothetical protein